MTNIELLGYLLTFALAIFFSSFAVNRKSVTFCLFSWISWHTLSALQLMLGYSTMLALVYLFLGLGFVFFVLTFVWAIQKFMDWRNAKEWELL